MDAVRRTVVASRPSVQLTTVLLADTRLAEWRCDLPKGRPVVHHQGLSEPVPVKRAQ